MTIFADEAGRSDTLPDRQTGGASGPFGNLPARLSGTREGRRQLQEADLRAGAIVAQHILTVGAMQSATAIYTEMLALKGEVIRDAQAYVSHETNPTIREEKARSSNAIYAELDIELQTLARTGCRGIGGVLERPLTTSRTASLLDRFGR